MDNQGAPTGATGQQLPIPENNQGTPTGATGQQLPIPENKAQTASSEKEVSGGLAQKRVVVHEPDIRQVKKLKLTDVSIPQPQSEFDVSLLTQPQSGSKPELSVRGPLIPDIDDGTKDPRLRNCYAVDVHKNLRIAEVLTGPIDDYMRIVQTVLKPGYRQELVCWLVQMYSDLQSRNLHLAVHLVDCFLAKNEIEVNQLQLVGITCILISCKFEDVVPKSIKQLRIDTKLIYTEAEILSMDIKVLDSCSYNLCVPTTDHFLIRYLRAAEYEISIDKLELVAKFLAELALASYEFLKFRPSMIAASSLFLATWTLNNSRPPWNKTMERYTSYGASELQESVFALQKLQKNGLGSSLIERGPKYEGKSDLLLNSLDLRETDFQ